MTSIFLPVGHMSVPNPHSHRLLGHLEARYGSFHAAYDDVCALSSPSEPEAARNRQEIRNQLFSGISGAINTRFGENVHENVCLLCIECIIDFTEWW